MIDAVVSDGGIRPLDPLPPDWIEGQPLRIEKADECEPTGEVIDRDFAVLDRLCAAGDAAEDDRLARSLDEAHRQAKEQVRKRMGLA